MDQGKKKIQTPGKLQASLTGVSAPFGLLRATVFRHFLGFPGLRRTSRDFISENHKLAVVKEIGAISLVKRGFR
jgi:hypothetical protein